MYNDTSLWEHNMQYVTVYTGLQIFLLYRIALSTKNCQLQTQIIENIYMCASE